MIVSCSDSRVIPESIFSAGIGDLFVIRVAGNVMDDHQLGSIEYAAEHLGIKQDQVLCIGDNENDMDMVREAGFGGCPSNACEALKACADYVAVSDNDHGGAAEVIAAGLGWT